MSKDELYSAEWLMIYDKLFPDSMYRDTFNIILGFIKKLNPDAKTVLEIGCGTGRYTKLFSDAGFAVKATDISNDAIAAAKKRVKNAEFQVANMSNFREPQIFDVAACLFEVFRYNPTFEECEKTIFNVYKALKPNGLFFCDFGIHPVTKNFNFKNEIKIGKKLFIREENINTEGNFDVREDKVTIIENDKKIEKEVARSPLLRISESKMVSMLKGIGFKTVDVVKDFREKRTVLFVAQK